MKAKGLIVNDLSAKERARMRDKVKPVIQKYTTVVGLDLVKQAYAEIERVRRQKWPGPEIRADAARPAAGLPCAAWAAPPAVRIPSGSHVASASTSERPPSRGAIHSNSLRWLGTKPNGTTGLPGCRSS